MCNLNKSVVERMNALHVEVYLIDNTYYALPTRISITITFNYSVNPIIPHGFWFAPHAMRRRRLGCAYMHII